jgi:hydrogenase 3 maturation protease
VENIFRPLLRGKLVLVGIGNPLRGDDGFGPALIERLQGKINASCIDAGAAPENYVGRIVREEPDIILLVDVAHLDLEPGQYRILPPEDIVKSGFTTHDMSSRMLIEFLQHQTQADIFLLGVQPQQVLLGEEMSACVAKTLAEVEQLIREAEVCTRPI